MPFCYYNCFDLNHAQKIDSGLEIGDWGVFGKRSIYLEKSAFCVLLNFFIFEFLNKHQLDFIMFCQSLTSRLNTLVPLPPRFQNSKLSSTSIFKLMDFQKKGCSLFQFFLLGFLLLWFRINSFNLWSSSTSLNLESLFYV